MYDGPGRYQHYKGGEYEVLGLAVREETKPDDIEGLSGPEINWDGVITEVIYRPLSEGSILPGPNGEIFWTRTLEDFNMMVEPPREFGIEQFVPPEATPPLQDINPLPVPRFQRLKPVNCLYFGAISNSQAGHQFVWGRQSQRGRLTTSYAEVIKHLPWDKVDGGLTPPGGGQSEAAFYQKDGWTCIAWVNRLFDTRPGSNSAFFFDTTLAFEQCIETARLHFPKIIQAHEQAGWPIKLYEEQVTRVIP